MRNRHSEAQEPPNRFAQDTESAEQMRILIDIDKGKRNIQYLETKYNRLEVQKKVRARAQQEQENLLRRLEQEKQQLEAERARLEQNNADRRRGEEVSKILVETLLENKTLRMELEKERANQRRSGTPAGLPLPPDLDYSASPPRPPAVTARQRKAKRKSKKVSNVADGRNGKTSTALSPVLGYSVSSPLLSPSIDVRQRKAMSPSIAVRQRKAKQRPKKVGVATESASPQNYGPSPALQLSNYSAPPPSTTRQRKVECKSETVLNMNGFFVRLFERAHKQCAILQV